MNRSTDNPWLHRFAVLTAGATLFLICLGGLVTSHGVGLSVPDWPTTYGYNMFFFPFSKWIGGIFYEHTHRLAASGVGLLTVILAVWLWLKEERCWLRWLGLVAVLSVVLQGILGGLRVTALKDELGIVHATLAQLFFALVCAIALFTSRWWRAHLGSTTVVGHPSRLPKSLHPSRLPEHEATETVAGTFASEDACATTGARWWKTAKLSVYGSGWLRYVYTFIAGMILLQLILGATMRHQHAGLAIPDFPAAYGKLWPDMDAASVASYNQLRHEVTAVAPITGAQVALQMAHRIAALLIAIGVLWSAWLTTRSLSAASSLAKLSWVWAGLILVQVGLGAATIWTDKSADIATAHVAVGALSLVTGIILALMAVRCCQVVQARTQSPQLGCAPDVFSVASGVPPDVEGGHLAARTLATNSPVALDNAHEFRRARRLGSTAGETPAATATLSA